MNLLMISFNTRLKRFQVFLALPPIFVINHTVLNFEVVLQATSLFKHHYDSVMLVVSFNISICHKIDFEKGLRIRTLTKAVAELYLFWNFGKLSIFVTQVLTEKKTTKPRLRKGSDFPILCIIVCIVSQEHVAYQDQW